MLFAVIKIVRNVFVMLVILLQSKEAPKNVESEPPACADGRQQLENKLVELQTKKSRMDSLLQELQMLHSLPLDNLRNNGKYKCHIY